MRITLGLVILLSLAPRLAATAGESSGPGHPAYPAFPWFFGPGYRHASTYEEGVQRGFADIVRSAGAANLMNSEAAKNYEDARRKRIDNRVYGAEKYFEMRKMNDAARAAERGRQPTMEDLIRYASQRAPGRLSPSTLDPLTGAISWPTILRGAAYDADRRKLEGLYASRATTGYLTADQAVEVGAAIDTISAEMKRNINSYPPQAYAQAKEFLKSLAYESLQRPD